MTGRGKGRSYFDDVGGGEEDMGKENNVELSTFVFRDWETDPSVSAPFSLYLFRRVQHQERYEKQRE